MTISFYPVCWRGREDCEPIHCLDSVPEGTAEDDFINFNYTPNSFVCSGCVKKGERIVAQDIYRLCFKNHCTDEMSDNDLQDLTSVLSVVAAALNLDAVRKVNEGIVEIPAAQAEMYKKVNEGVRALSK